MTTPCETLHFGTRRIGRRVLLFDELPSTNDSALDADVEDGTVVVAGHQSAGRGQYGRTWLARPGTSLLMSVRLRPPPEVRRPAILTAWAAVGVAGAVHELTGLDVRVKWPNDLFLDGKKVCGILIELHGEVAVAGIGLNLAQTAAEFAAAGLTKATSLAVATGVAVDHRTALTVVVRHLDNGYGRLIDGRRAEVEAEWARRIGLFGRHVSVELADGRSVAGRLRDMGFDGIELETGEQSGFRVLAPESVRHIRPVGD